MGSNTQSKPLKYYARHNPELTKQVHLATCGENSP